MANMINAENLSKEANFSEKLGKLKQLLKKLQDPSSAEHKLLKGLKNYTNLLNAVSALVSTFEKLSNAETGASLDKVLDSKIISEQISGLTAAIKKIFSETVDAQKATVIIEFIFQTQDTLFGFLQELQSKSQNHPLVANSAGTINMQVLQQYNNIPAQKRISEFDSLKEKLSKFLMAAYDAHMDAEKQRKAQARKAALQAEAEASKAKTDGLKRKNSVVAKPEEAGALSADSAKAPLSKANGIIEPQPVSKANGVTHPQPASKVNGVANPNHPKTSAKTESKGLFESRQSLQDMLDAYEDPSKLDATQSLSSKDAILFLGKLGLAQQAKMKKINNKKYQALPFAKRREYDAEQAQRKLCLHDWDFIDANPDALTEIFQEIAEDVVPALNIHDLANACHHLSESYIAHDNLNAAIIRQIHKLLLDDPLKLITDPFKPDFNLADHTEDFPELGQQPIAVQKGSNSAQQSDRDQKIVQECVSQEYTFCVKDMHDILGFLLQMRCNENSLVPNVNEIIKNACQCTYLVIKKFLEGKNKSAEKNRDAFTSISNIVHNLAMLVHALPDIDYQKEFSQLMNPVLITFRRLGKLEIDKRFYCISIKDGIFWYALTKGFLNNLNTLKKDRYEAALIEGRNPYETGAIEDQNEHDKNGKLPTEFEKDVEALLNKIFPEATIKSEYLLGAHRYDFYITNTRFKRDFTIECDGTFYHHMMRYNDTGFTDGEYLDGKSQFKRKFAQKLGICAVNVPYAAFYDATNQRVFLEALMGKELLGIDGPMVTLSPKLTPLAVLETERKVSLDSIAPEMPKFQARANSEPVKPHSNPKPPVHPVNPAQVQPRFSPDFQQRSSPQFVPPLGINPNLAQLGMPAERSPSIASSNSSYSLVSPDSASLLGSPQYSPPSTGFPSPFESPADSPTRRSPLPMFRMDGAQQQNGQQQRVVLVGYHEVEQQLMMRERERRAEQEKMERQLLLQRAEEWKRMQEAAFRQNLALSAQNQQEPQVSPQLVQFHQYYKRPNHPLAMNGNVQAQLAPISEADQEPAFAPQGPVFAPQGPAFAPQGPAFAPQGPAFAPQGPAFAPQGPAMAPNGPGMMSQGLVNGFNPQGPGIIPGQPMQAAQPALTSQENGVKPPADSSTVTTKKKLGIKQLSRHV